VKVGNVHIIIRLRFLLNPQKKAFFGRKLLKTECERKEEEIKRAINKPSSLMSWIWKRRMMVQIKPKIRVNLPSTISKKGEM